MPVPYLDTAWPRILAHRGLALGAPENSLLAFQRALAAGATHLETDVQLSRDGVAVVSHDPDLRRLAGRRARIAELTVAELREIDLGVGQGIPTLIEALTTFPQARFNIDVKDAGASAATAAAVLEAGAVDRVLITSFSERRRAATVALLPGVASSASTPSVLRALAAVKAGRAAAVRAALGDVVAVQVPERRLGLHITTVRFIEAVHAAGIEVHVWTVNEVADMRRLLAIGVDGLVTDRADRAVELVR